MTKDKETMASTWRLVRRGLLLAALFPMVWGCSESHERETASVSGTVTLDGKPLASGGVMFFPRSGRGSVGNINEDGTYQMGTYHNNDGATVGVHRVIVKVKKNRSNSDKETAVAPSGSATLSIPSHYENPKTSGLEYEVKADEDNIFDIKLESKEKSKR